MSKLEKAFLLAKQSLVADDRPELLKAMTAAAPTTERYNFYLYYLVRVLEPTLFVETGTDRGRSAVHVACGSPSTRVISIDIDIVCSTELRDVAVLLGLRNVESRTGDSIAEAQSFDDNEIDLLFLDSLHTYDHLKQELKVYLPKMRSGGLIILDDIYLDAGMLSCWHEITLEKRDISNLHFSGFGLVEVP